MHLWLQQIITLIIIIITQPVMMYDRATTITAVIKTLAIMKTETVSSPNSLLLIDLTIYDRRNKN
jgi:hypothetical protein